MKFPAFDSTTLLAWGFALIVVVVIYAWGWMSWHISTVGVNVP